MVQIQMQIQIQILQQQHKLWSPNTNLPLPGQPSQDLATSMAPIHESSAPGTAFSGPRYFCGLHTHIFRSRDSLPRLQPVRLVVSDSPILRASSLPGRLPSIASLDCSTAWFPSFASQSGIEVLLLNLASRGWGSLDAGIVSSFCPLPCAFESQPCLRLCCREEKVPFGPLPWPTGLPVPVRCRVHQEIDCEWHVVQLTPRRQAAWFETSCGMFEFECARQPNIFRSPSRLLWKKCSQ